MKISRRKGLLLLILFTCLAQGPQVRAEDETGHQHHEKHGMGSRSVEEYIAMFEDPSRAEWQMPNKVVESMGLKEGDAVADIGAGSGYFSVLFSKKVGETGKVVALDVEQGMIHHIKKRMEKEGIKNITPVLCEPGDPNLSENSVDLIFICDTWHHIFNRAAYLKLIAKALKPGGRLAIVDFKKEPTPQGPPMRMRLSRGEVVHEITSAGYTLAKEFDFLPFQYFLVFEVKGE